jgi:hypothetical protein
MAGRRRSMDFSELRRSTMYRSLFKKEGYVSQNVAL